MTILQKNTELVRTKAIELGFEACGFAMARKLDEEAYRLEDWLNANKHGTMSWMENHFDKRVDPRLLVPGAKSVISVFCVYKNQQAEKEHERTDVPKISKYALGDDYHDVLKSQLYELFEYINSLIGKIEGRVFVDSAPVLDKAWAVQSGLGWVGKNSNVLNKDWGSWFFLGEIILDVEFEYDSPTTSHCGSCTRCLDACPTQAIYEPYKVDANRCISYLTIELREQIPQEFHQDMGNWMYGCDVCQDVCPWNRKSGYGKNEALFPRDSFLGKDLDFWEELNIDLYRDLFRKSAVKRTKFQGLSRNISAVSSNLKKS